MAEYYQRGESIDYVNETDAKIEAGDIVEFGSHVGVAGCPMEPGETGSLHMVGVFAMPKGSDAIEAGADVTYADGEVSAASSGDGDEGGSSASVIGYAVEAATADDTTVKVKLLG
ncbi:MAG: DUF2190 family protein [Coprobacillus sp.]|nr:DUF2190 family protein [Coprobacillus sp.]